MPLYPPVVSLHPFSAPTLVLPIFNTSAATFSFYPDTASLPSESKTISTTTVTTTNLNPATATNTATDLRVHKIFNSYSKDVGYETIAYI